MDLSRQEKSPTTGERSNQKARTRGAILDAAIELLREGRPASVPEAAKRARVSLATAYRYFPSAEDLGDEASIELIDFLAADAAIREAIEAAGEDVHARLEALIRALGWRMLTEQMPFRQQAKAGLDRWFAQQQVATEDRVPVRMGRRNAFTRQVLVPVEDRLTKEQLEQLVAALAIGWGTEAAITLTDVALLDPEPALETMVTTCRWILDGALAAAGVRVGDDG
jgi:AcrR family transcriptional regulator